MGNPVPGIIQDSALGLMIRFITKGKYCAFPEDDPNFQIPWEQAAATEKEKEMGGSQDASRDSTTNTTPSGLSPQHSAGRPDDVEAGREVARIQTANSATRSEVGAITRTSTRERTLPYSRERLEVEESEAIERQHSTVIAPQRTNDGVILVDWYTTDDPANPQNWSSRKKNWVTFNIFMYTFIVYAASSIYTSTEPQIMHKFGIGQSKASLLLSMYVMGYGIGPMLFSPLSEIPVVGRTLPYVVSFALFLILCVPTALANSYATLMVMRFLTGFMGSPCLATGGATLGDIFGLLKMPYALTIWVSAAFCAPAVGPLLSGFSVVVKGWRWAFWEVLWGAAPIFVMMFMSLPETNANNILLRRAQRLRKLTGNPNLKSQGEIDQRNMSFSGVIAEALWRPMEICFKDPAVFFTNLYTSLLYGIYYSFFEAFPLVYIPIYGFNIGQLGIVYLCIVVGCVFGASIYCSYVYFYVEPDLKKNGPRAQEHRLWPALFASFLLPAGMFWFGWTSRSDIHWIVSIIGITFFAMGAFIILQCVFMYLPLSYPQYAASLFAANDLSRSTLAAASVIYAHPLYTNLGIGRGVSVLAGLLCGGIIGIWAIWYYGAALRARSKFALK